MAFRALLFSKDSETNAAMTAGCKKTGIRVEVCSDIFTAIDKAKKQPFSCVIVDWADQPESSFLLKRAYESEVNRETVGIAVVDRDPTPVELRDSRLGFFIQRPVFVEAAEALLAKAREKMPESGDEDPAEPAEEDNHNASAVDASSPGADQTLYVEQTSPEVDPAEDSDADASIAEEPSSGNHGIGRGIFAALLVLAAIFFFWRSHEFFGYLAQTPEGGYRVLQESVAALFHSNPSVASPDASAGSSQQPDADHSRDAHAYNGQTPSIRVVATEAVLAETTIPLRKPPDFPLPVPTVERHEIPPVHKGDAAIPESMKNSATIAPPVVVTVSPAQMMPVSAPLVQPAIQPISEPVTVTEAAERALLIHTVDPVYPPEALAQKLHGTVVLQARVGRDGSVEDLKLVRGYFVLGRAAIAAVQQWRFQPYSINGHPAATQTVITVNFSAPPPG